MKPTEQDMGFRIYPKENQNLRQEKTILQSNETLRRLSSPKEIIKIDTTCKQISRILTRKKKAEKINRLINNALSTFFALGQIFLHLFRFYLLYIFPLFQVLKLLLMITFFYCFDNCCNLDDPFL